MRTILFVCTGNTCRSPLAEAIARQWLRDGGLGGLKENFIASAGIAAPAGSAVTSETIVALRQLGIDHYGTAKSLSREMVEKADLVLCMTDDHVDSVKDLVGHDSPHAKKVHRLDPAEEVSDPVGMGQAAYTSLARKMKRLIPKRLEELLTHEDRARVGSSR